MCHHEALSQAEIDADVKAAADAISAVTIAHLGHASADVYCALSRAMNTLAHKFECSERQTRLDGDRIVSILPVPSRPAAKATA